MDASSTLLSAEHVTFGYGGQPVLSDLSFRLNQRGSLAILGGSGCGKTSLLYLIAGLRTPKGGTIQRNWQPGSGLRLIQQDYGLFPWKRVKDNIELGARLAGRSIPPYDALLERLGIAGCSGRWPRELSAGQKQRVALARALLAPPEILLLDEAFAALDVTTREDLEALMHDLWREVGFGLVVVTHSIEEAVAFGETILVMSPAGRPARWLANPACRDGAYRERPEFLVQCLHLRAMLKADTSS